MLWNSLVKTAKCAWQLFKAFGEKVASVMNFIILIPVYFIGVGFTKLLAKISGATILKINVDEENKSYWSSYDCKTEQKEKYKRMF